MKLSVARLCVDCEEVHDHQRCPACGSTTFAFLKQWVEPSYRAASKPAADERLQAYRRLLVADALRPKAARLLRSGAVGLAAISLARWMWRAYYPRRHAERRERGSGGPVA